MSKKFRTTVVGCIGTGLRNNRFDTDFDFDAVAVAYMNVLVFVYTSIVFVDIVSFIK